MVVKSLKYLAVVPKESELSGDGSGGAESSSTETLITKTGSSRSPSPPKPTPQRTKRPSEYTVIDKVDDTFFDAVSKKIFQT